MTNGSTGVPPDRAGHSRRGSVLLAVLAIVALLSLAAWKYCDSMVAERAAVAAHARQVERQMLVDSGIAWTQAQLRRHTRQQRRSTRTPARPDPAFSTLAFEFNGPAAVPVLESGRFTVLHREHDDSHVSSGLRMRPGTYDLSGLIDINALHKIDKQSGRETARHFLMALPRMTVDAADSILDFLARPSKPGPATRGLSDRPITSLKLLARVPGVSFTDLFGEDTNRNGLLDPNEDANRDGQLQVGWSHYLTTINGEANRRPDGSRRINLNQSSLAKLYDQIEQQFGPRLARFVVAFRMHGALSDLSRQPGEAPTAEAQRRAAMARSRLQLGEPSAATTPEVSAADLQRGGLDLSVGPVFRIESLVDLFGTSVRTLVDGQDTVLSAPWSADATTVFQQLSRLRDDLTVSDEPVIHGRINVFAAPRTVLLAVPGITIRSANMIVAARGRIQQPPDNIGWLMDQGILSHAELRRVAPFINASGDYYRATVIAESSVGDGRRSAIRSLSGSRLTFDATRPIPAILSHHPLTARECRIRLAALVQSAVGHSHSVAFRNSTHRPSRLARRSSTNNETSYAVSN